MLMYSMTSLSTWRLGLKLMYSMTSLYLEVLSDVGLQHPLEALHGVLHRQGPEEVYQPV